MNRYERMHGMDVEERSLLSGGGEEDELEKCGEIGSVLMWAVRVCSGYGGGMECSVALLHGWMGMDEDVDASVRAWESGEVWQEV